MIRTDFRVGDLIIVGPKIYIIITMDECACLWSGRYTLLNCYTNRVIKIDLIDGDRLLSRVD